MTAMATPPTPAVRKPLFRIAGSLVLLILMAIVFPRHRLAAALQSINLTTLGMIVPAYLVVHFLGCLKWRWMVNRGGAALSVMEAVRCYYAGMFSNLFIPSVIGGDVVVAAMGISRSGNSEAIVSGTLANRLIDLLALLALATVAVLALPRAADPEAERLIGLILLVFLAAVAAAACVALLFRAKIGRRVEPYWRALLSLFRSPAFALAAFGLALTMQCGLLTLTAWVGEGCGADVPLRGWLFAWPLAKLSAFVPLTLAGIGTREFVLAALLIPMGTDPALGAVIGLAWDAVFIIGGVIAGAVSKSASLLMPVRPSGEPCVP